MPETVRLADYRPPAHRVESVELRFDLDPERTRVRSRLAIVSDRPPAPLVLFGSALELLDIRLDGRSLAPSEYRIDGERLEIADPPGRFVLEVDTVIAPAANTALEGLYRSAGMFCTQCEAEGFRRITWYPDRPDVMARFTVTLEADRASCPVLLSNGNCIATGSGDGGRHWARWEDPFPKPSYLFALVAGDLACARDSFTTMSGRTIDLELYVEHHNLDQTAHALRALQQAMAWDEQHYGREYDLDRYMIVAVDDFNMGAMENKGLNIFNSSAVLAKPETATDADFQRIESIVAHEYFHNWTGNRITCRDWFQLSLKEGLTVFRDQQFSADTYSAAVQRIQDVNLLRTYQFAEDAGPMAHPVRPEQFIEINNFYTLTVYNKGAEVIRMLHTLVGADGFRRGMDLYFACHDGQAVTVEDFIACHAEANGVDLHQFMLWYRQSGTPRLEVNDAWDAAAGRYTLTFRQSCPPTPDRQPKRPLHIPVATALLAGDGRQLPLRLVGDDSRRPAATTRVLELRDAEQEFIFVDLPERPEPSLLRGFSAPVALEYRGRASRLPHLMRHDDDPFNRWDAAQQQAIAVLLEWIEAIHAGRAPRTPEALHDGFAATLDDPALDPALVALALLLPSESYLSQLATPVDPEAIHAARRQLREALSESLGARFLARYQRLATATGSYRFSAAAAGMRSLKGVCLAFLMERPDPEVRALCQAQFVHADNMTDALSALTALANSDVPERLPALAAFRERWRDDPRVLDKWLSLQAMSRLPGTLERVVELMNDPLFSLRNPNRVRALIGAFCNGNPAQFHAADGSGYAFLGTQVRALDAINPQVAARLLGPLSQWRRYDVGRQALIQAELEQVLTRPGLSSDLFEVATKIMAAPPAG